jgi:hypothetical protein
MNLRLRQSAKPKPDRKDYWDWAVWLDGSEELLKEVERVDYRLHPTFPQSNRSSSSAKTRFRIRSYGWGEFLLYATVHFKDGRSITLEHWLKLRDSDGPSGTPVKQVYLSHTAGDKRGAEAARKSLEAAGIDVRTSDDLPNGVPWEIGLTNLISSSDAVVVLAPEDESRAVDTDIAIARDLKRTVYPVVLSGRSSSLPREMDSIQQIQLKEPGELGDAIKAVDIKK